MHCVGDNKGMWPSKTCFNLTQVGTEFPRLLESPAIVCVKFTGPGKFWKMSLVLESPGICQLLELKNF